MIPITFLIDSALITIFEYTEKKRERRERERECFKFERKRESFGEKERIV